MEMVIQTNLLILLLAAIFSPTSQSPCKISVYCSCESIGNNITLICAEESNLDNFCDKWPGCVVCSKGQGCQECQGESRCTDTKQRGKPRQKREDDETSETLSCIDPGFISKGIRKDVNGSISDRYSRRRYKDGESVTYSCTSQEHRIGGSAVLTCSNATWSAPRPRCVSKSEIVCTDPGFISNGIRVDGDETESNSRRSYYNRETVAYRCKSQYFTIIGASVLTCSGGSWSAPRPRCVPAAEKIGYCDNPGKILNGEREYFSLTGESSEEHLDDPKYPQGIRLEYWCEDGYHLEGEEVIFCESSGSWSSEPPSCRTDNGPKFCFYPGPIANAKASYIPAPGELGKTPKPVQDEETFLPGAILQYTCDSGYSTYGKRSMTCQSTGIWSDTLPSCINVSFEFMLTCENRGRIENGRVTRIFPDTGQVAWPFAAHKQKQVPVGTILRYSCEDGYDLQGESKVTCMNTSHWSALPPTCKSECGFSTVTLSGHITNGIPTHPGDWPWVVAIAIERENGYKEKVCGGAVWSSGVVVTAAHCLTDADTFSLYFGKVHLDDKYDDDAEVQVRTSTRKILHPDYNNVTFEFDIGLVMFEPRVSFTNRIFPICRPTGESTARNLQTGSHGYVTGWGETEKGVQASSLLLAVLPFQTKEVCTEAFKSHNLDFSTNRNMFCAGFEDGQISACSGDSGSPLVFYDSDELRFYLEGIVSFGIRGQCGMPKKYTVFTRVHTYVPWINRNVL